MEVNFNIKTYEELLIQLLNKEDNLDITQHKEQLELNIYLTLLSLSNLKYKKEIYEKENALVDNFLRKTNNLKVKIQLKRKEEEINKLIEEITEIYNNNKLIISKYNKEDLDIISIISSKDAKNITELIDKLTKIKIVKNDKKEENEQLREKISNSILINKYYIEEGIIYIESDEQISISLDNFYELYEHLLNIDTYGETFKNIENNKEHTQMIANIIKIIISNEKIDNMIIPIVLTHLLKEQNNISLDVDTSSFNIENIKITELYSLATPENQTDNQKVAKWNKIKIPNEYLFKQINEIIKKGMYYFKEDKFILENIDNDFKISIQVEKMLDFLKENIENTIKLDINKRVKTN